MILYLSYWFPARERARAVGLFMSAIAISYAIGAPISGGIMSAFDGVAGLKDWQWLFAIEAIPAIVAGIVVFLKLIPRHSDRTGERKGHVAACLALAAVAFAVSTVVSPVAAVGALAVGLFFLLGVHGVFWTMPAALLGGTAAAAGIAMINSIGNLGGFGGPYLVGLVKDATGSTDGDAQLVR
jgi:MFS family permease